MKTSSPLSLHIFWWLCLHHPAPSLLSLLSRLPPPDGSGEPEAAEGGREREIDGAAAEGNVAVPQGGRLQPAGEVGPLRLLLRGGRLRLRGTYPSTNRRRFPRSAMVVMVVS